MKSEDFIKYFKAKYPWSAAYADSWSRNGNYGMIMSTAVLPLCYGMDRDTCADAFVAKIKSDKVVHRVLLGPNGQKTTVFLYLAEPVDCSMSERMRLLVENIRDQTTALRKLQILYEKEIDELQMLKAQTTEEWWHDHIEDYITV